MNSIRRPTSASRAGERDDRRGDRAPPAHPSLHPPDERHQDDREEPADDDQPDDRQRREDQLDEQVGDEDDGDCADDRPPRHVGPRRRPLRRGALLDDGHLEDRQSATALARQRRRHGRGPLGAHSDPRAARATARPRPLACRAVASVGELTRTAHHIGGTSAARSSPEVAPHRLAAVADRETPVRRERVDDAESPP